jgi:hypothetical protein
MSDTLNQDSTKTFKSIVYQFIVALEKCFEMQGNESIWIEKYGDVTSSNGEQIEVKDYQKDLTDLDHNIWKTLKNWLNDEFNVSYYHSFVLLTTQTVSNTSKFIDWNYKNKEEKLEILNAIKQNFNFQERKSDTTQKLLNKVLDVAINDKLLKILDKFIICSKYEKDESLYKKLIETRADGILTEKKDEYIGSLFSYIISPEVTSSGWEIKNKEFRQKTKSLIETYATTTKIFPKINVNPLTDNIIDEHKKYLFVKKIEDIEYDEVKNEAISDFIYSRRVLNEELKNYEISKKEHDSYEGSIFKNYEPKYRKALRSANPSNSIYKSKDLYDDVMGELVPNFYNFNDTPVQYRNGLLHEMANDDKKLIKIIWKLEANDE